jgi:hypothetical protein
MQAADLGDQRQQAADLGDQRPSRVPTSSYVTSVPCLTCFVSSVR